MIHRILNVEDLSINERELEARLSYGSVSDEMIKRLYSELSEVARPSYTAIRVKLLRENDGIVLGTAHSKSRSLMRLCRESSECFLLSATLGLSVDRLIMKRSLKSPSEAFVIDALADTMIEAVCDAAENEVTDGLDTTGRFSPGYGDLELSLGSEILTLCDAEKLLGIKMTESGLMVPKKSVSAIIAIKDNVNENNR